ncbi:MAG: N-acetyl sugar amidotransferase [Bacteroidota bacterium]
MAIALSGKVTDEIYDQQLSTIPQNVIFCNKCVVSNQRPRIEFDDNGVCSACSYAEEKHNVINWDDREHELQLLLDAHRSKNGSFDVVVPGSGGKDSSIVTHKLKHEYGMHPLSVTWAPFIYTDIGFRNYFNFIQSGFTNILMYPDGKLHRKLTLLSFDLCGDAWDPFAYGQQSWAFQVSAKFRIPLIMFGENGDVEYGGTTRNKNKHGEPIDEWSELYYRGRSINWLVEQGRKRGLFEVDDKTLEMYNPPDRKILDDIGCQMHWWSYYKPWLPQEHYYYAVGHTGFSANYQRSEGTYSKYASLDDRLDGFHFYLAYMKFGICRATSDAAHEVRDGHLTRDEAVALVKRYDGEFPVKYFSDFLEYLDITEEDFWYVCDKFRSCRPHLWRKQGDSWVLDHTVWGEQRIWRKGELIK